jgi:hypothetical protein
LAVCHAYQRQPIDIRHQVSPIVADVSEAV